MILSEEISKLRRKYLLGMASCCCLLILTVIFFSLGVRLLWYATYGLLRVTSNLYFLLSISESLSRSCKVLACVKPDAELFNIKEFSRCIYYL